MKPIKLQRNQKLTMSQAKELFGSNVSSDQISLTLETVGPWSLIKSCKGLCTTQDFTTGELTIFGNRSLSNANESGYNLEGRVSIAGKRYSAFTSSHLFELENGHLIDVGILHARMK